MIKDLIIDYDFYKKDNIIENEIWMWVKHYVKGELKVDFTDSYLISNYGRCRSVDRIIQYKNLGTRLVNGIYRRPSYIKPEKARRCMGNRHLKFGLWLNSQQFNCPIHKLVKESFDGPPPLGKQVSHIDENCYNNQLINLQWLTPLEHKQYDNHALKISGEKNGLAKLTDKQVLDIRQKHLTYNTTYANLAREFHVSSTHISYIIKNKVRNSV